MLALVAVLLANADGRSGIALSRLLSARSDRRVTVGIAFGAFIVNAVVAATAGAIANRMIGQGVAALLVTLAMLSAATSASMIASMTSGLDFQALGVNARAASPPTPARPRAPRPASVRAAPAPRRSSRRERACPEGIEAS